jgi:hypothetical protein
MDQIESNTHSFVVKVWLEEVHKRSGKTVWRGHITHVPSGERRYFEDLAAIDNFIVPYLQQMGVDLGIWRRMRYWLKRVRLPAA